VSMTRKEQAEASRRIESVEWYREQIKKLIESCDENIKEDQELADSALYEVRDKYIARVETAQHYRKQLARVLRGRTFADDLAESLKRGARRRG
jgi:hypothetical protein